MRGIIWKRGARLWPFLLVSFALSSCGEERRLVPLVQLCLQNESGLQAFSTELRQFSETEGMTFVDDGAAAARDLSIIDPEQHAHDEAGPNIRLSLRGHRELITASNLGLRGYQVAMGLSYAPGSGNERSTRLMRRLARRWQIIRVPDGMGAKPLENCN